MEYKIGICDEDCHYMLNLMEFINSRNSIPIKMIAFSSVQAIEEYLAKGYLDGLLIGGTVDLSKQLEDGIIHIVEDRDLAKSVSNDEAWFRCIFKYQSADKIAEEIISVIGNGVTSVDKEEAVFVGVYSPVGRCGKTKLAKAISRYYENCLYVGFEDFGFRHESGEGFLYCLVEENTQIVELLQGKQEITGISSYMDIREVRKENLSWLKTLLGRELSYNRIVFDMGVGALWDIDILSVMDIVYVPVLEDEASKEKLEAFKKLVSQSKYRLVENKLIYVEVPNTLWKEIHVEEVINRR